MPPRVEKIPRPPNAFMLYRSDMGPRLPPPLPPGTARSQSEVSQMVAKLWHNETLAVRAEFKRRAAEKKMEHQVRYPGYTYKPRRKEAEMDMKVEVEKREKEVKVAKRARRMQDCDGSGRDGTASTEPRFELAPQTSTSTAGFQSTSHAASYNDTPQYHPSLDPVTGEVLDLDVCPELSYYAFEQALRDVFGNPDNHIEFYTTRSSSPYSSDGQLGGGSDMPSWDSGYAPASGGVMARHAGFNDGY